MDNILAWRYVETNLLATIQRRKKKKDSLQWTLGCVCVLVPEDIPVGEKSGASVTLPEGTWMRIQMSG